MRSECSLLDLDALKLKLFRKHLIFSCYIAIDIDFKVSWYSKSRPNLDHYGCAAAVSTRQSRRYEKHYRIFFLDEVEELVTQNKVVVDYTTMLLYF